MIPVENAHLLVAAKSHPGLSGKTNEDRFAVSAYRVSTSDATPAVFGVVSDGIGGHLAGEVAAGIAVETISQIVGESDARQPTEILKEAILKASQEIALQSEADLEQAGMGATCACVWVIGQRLYTGSVGDSRIYLVQGRTIRQLTRDHTWIQEAMDHGALTREQARNHPNQHVIRRYLGSRQASTPDLRLHLHPEEGDQQAESNQGLLLQPNDTLLLCTDGLTDLVMDGEILTALTSRPLDQAIEHLIRMANERGGHDNITMVAVKVPPAERKPFSVVPRGFLALACLGVGFLLMVALLMAIYLGWYFTRPGTPFF